VSWYITVDRVRCIGSGLCVHYAGGTFDQDLEAKCVVRESITDELDAIESAVEACPTSAIALSHEAKGVPG
jgi:ferredoxin